MYQPGKIDYQALVLRVVLAGAIAGAGALQLSPDWHKALLAAIISGAMQGEAFLHVPSVSAPGPPPGPPK